MSHDERLSPTFVELADTLGDNFDPIDQLLLLSERCRELLGVSAVGVLLGGDNGRLAVAAATSEPAGQLVQAELQHDQGPGLEAFRSVRVVSAPELAGAVDRWPAFGPPALAAGFASVHAIPLRLRSDVIGAIVLFAAESGSVRPVDLELGQALVDIATIGILHERAIRRTGVLAEQLQSALSSRIVIEQAKGVLAARSELAVDEAFQAMRGYARRNRLRLVDVAHQVVDGTLAGLTVLRPPAMPTRLAMRQAGPRSSRRPPT